MDKKSTASAAVLLFAGISAVVTGSIIALPLTPVVRILVWTAGGVMILVSLVRLIASITHKKASHIAVIPVLGITVFFALFSFSARDKIRSLFSIRKEGRGIYSMTYYGDAMTDEALNAGLMTPEDFSDWIRRKEFYNFPYRYEDPQNGCSAFTSSSDKGGILFGFNFDAPETGVSTLIVYTHPSDGYASMATVPLGQVFGTEGYDPDLPDARLLMLSAPYIINDGINEAGLGITSLQLKIGETHQDNGKPDVTGSCLLKRAILDHCATVEEAVELISHYDVHSHKGVSFHFFICDRTGKAVVVEWFGNEMSVVEADACTNSALAPEHLGEGSVDERLPTLQQTLEESGGILSAAQARNLLNAVSQEGYTDWSSLYDLDRLTLSICLNEEYGSAYCFELSGR